MIHFIYSDFFSNKEACWGTPLLICLFMVENFIDFCNYKVGKMWPVFAHNSATACKSGRGREMILHKINPFSHSWLLFPESWTLALTEVLLEFAEWEPLLLPALFEFPPRGRGLLEGCSHPTGLGLVPAGSVAVVCRFLSPHLGGFGSHEGRGVSKRSEG